MDYGLGFLGEYITAAELVGKTPTLTINKVTLEKVESLKHDDGDGVGKLKDKIVIYFAESKSGRGWLLNRTNAEALKELWGRETNNWLGHKVTLFVQQVRVGKKMEPGIRVKGSPELTAPRAFELKLPRKKPIMTTLLPTGKPAPADVSEPEKALTPKTTQHGAPTLDDALKLLDQGKREDALALRDGLSADDQARFDMEFAQGEAAL